MGLREILKKAAPLSPAAQFRIKRTKLEEALLKHIKAFENDTGLTVSKVSPYANPGESKTARVEIVAIIYLTRGYDMLSACLVLYGKSSNGFLAR